MWTSRNGTLPPQRVGFILEERDLLETDMTLAISAFTLAIAPGITLATCAPRRTSAQAVHSRTE